MPTIRRIKVAAAAAAEAWVRPADWLALPTVVAGDQKIVALHAVYDTDANFCALICQGAYTVDWGDGSAAENVASNVQAQHLYAYADLGAGTLCTRGYRQAVVTVTPQAGQNLTLVNFSRKHTQAGLQNGYAAQWLDIRMAGASFTSVLCYTANTAYCRMLEQFEFIGSNGITNMSYMFYYCSSLQSVPLFVTSNVTNMSSMFYACYSLQSVPLFVTSAVTDMSYMFYNCSSLPSVPLFVTSAVTNMSYMFYACYSLQSVPLFVTSAVTDMTGMLRNCSSLQSVPLFDTAKVTNMSYMFLLCPSLPSVPALNTAALTAATTSMFAGDPSLQSAPLAGTPLTISYASCKLSRAAIVAIFNGLKSGVTAQTITVTGNWGVPYLTADDRLIATNKGWTIAS